MKKKGFKCAICGANTLYDESTKNLICIECNATHALNTYNVEKKKGGRYRLTKTKILVAVLSVLYIMYFFYRYATY